MVVIINRIKPSWFREIELVIHNSEHTKSAGVYIYFLGDNFYVGESYNVRRRLVAHKHSINRMIKDMYYSGDSWYNHGSYTNIFNHIKENPSIKEIHAYIVEQCDNKEMAVKAEEEYLKLLRGHFLGSRCLNKQFYYGLTVEDIMELGY